MSSNKLIGPNRQEEIVAPENREENPSIVAVEIPSISLPPISLRICEKNTVNDETGVNKGVLAAKEKLFKKTTKKVGVVVNAQDDDEEFNSNLIKDLCIGNGKQRNNVVSNGKLNRTCSGTNSTTTTTCVGSSSISSPKEGKNVTPKSASVNSSMHKNTHFDDNKDSVTTNGGKMKTYSEKDYLAEFDIFEKSLEAEVIAQDGKNKYEDGQQRGSTTDDSLKKSPVSSSGGPTNTVLDWRGNNYNYYNMPHHTNNVSTYSSASSGGDGGKMRTLNQSSSTSCSTGNYYLAGSNRSSADIEIDMEGVDDDDDDEAEEILGDLHDDSDDMTAATGANINLKYLSTNNNNSQYKYTGILFPNPSSSSSYTSNSNKNCACPTTSTTTTTTISHSVIADSAIGSRGSSLSSYIFDSDGSNCSRNMMTMSTTSNDSGGITPCSSIWDGMNQLCSIKTCSQPASKKCKSCRSAFYCSESHQKEHWKKHKNECIPFKMEIIDHGRSVMVAVRTIPAGVTIFSEKPFLVFPVACVENDFLHIMDFNCVMDEMFDSCTAKKPACLGCMKIVEFIGPARHQCSKCGLPLCSEQCENEMAHIVGECIALQQGNLRELDENRYLKSCFHTLYMDVEILRALQLENYDRPQWERFLELRHHVRVESYKKSSRFDTFVRNISRLVPLSAKVSGYNYDLLCDCHAITTALSFKPALKSPYKMLIGTQLLFAHECIPNTISYIEEQMPVNVHRIKCVVKSSVTIMKGDWISMDFVPTPYLSYPLRRKTLENMYLHCSCRRCVAPAELGDHSNDIQCSTCRRGSVVPENPLRWNESVWSCCFCQEEVSYSHINKVYCQWRKRLAYIPKSRKGLNELINYIREANEALNRTHELVIMAWCFVETILRPTVEAYRYPDATRELPKDVINDFALLNEYCDVVDEHFNSIRPGIWLDRGIILFHKFYASFALASYEYQKILKSNSTDHNSTDDEYEKHSLPRKEFITQVLRSMKLLKQSLEILIVYEGYNATPYVSRLTEQATYTLHTVKDYVGRLIKEDPTFATATPNSFRKLV